MRGNPRVVGVFVAVCVVVLPGVVFAQQQAAINGKVLDPAGLPLPGATITVTEPATGFTRTVASAQNGAYEIRNLTPGTYSITVEMSGFTTLTRSDLTLRAGAELTLDYKLQLAGVQEAVTVTAAAPLVERTNNRIGGTLTGKEIEDVPSNFRNFTALTQLIPGMTPNPAASTFEGGQVTANGTVAQSNLYLLDGAYNNDDRLGGSQGTQVRIVLDDIEEYQVLANQYSAEYGGGGGAIINMVSHGGTNSFRGRFYNYFRSDRFNSRNAFLPASAAKPEERTLQSGISVGGPIVKNRIHFFSTFERDHEKNTGYKVFPAAAAPLAVNQFGLFEVRAENIFNRFDVQLNSNNFLNYRSLLEPAPTKGEGFNTNTQTPDARAYEADWDHLEGLSLTSILSDRGSNVLRLGYVAEDLRSGSQSFFEDTSNVFGYGIKAVGFNGRDPFAVGQLNVHPSYATGKGGAGAWNRIRTYTFDDAISYFIPAWRGEHTLKAGGGYSINSDVPQRTANSGTFTFTGTNGDLPYNPANPLTYPTQFTVTLGPPAAAYWETSSTDHRSYFFVEDKWRPTDRLTLNLGVRWDHQSITPDSKDDFAPRTGFVVDVTGKGTSVIRGGIGRFNAYLPISVDLAHQASGIITRFPSLTITAANDTCGCILRPDVIRDSAGNLGVAVLSAAGIANLQARRDAILAGTNFNTTNPRVDSAGRQMPYQWSWSLGWNQQLGGDMAVTADYVGNVSKDQFGQVDINEPVNRVRPGITAIEPLLVPGTLPAAARTLGFGRVLQSQTNPAFDGDYHSLQVSVVKRFSHRWSARGAYTLQKSHYVGLGNPDARRVWLDNDIRADYGRFASDKRHVLALSGTVNPFKAFTIASVLSAATGGPINEITGTDANGDGDNNNDRPIKGVNDATIPIRSEVDSQGRAVINGIQGNGTLLLDVSFRYQIPVTQVLKSLDLFYDIFNVGNRKNITNPSGNRSSSLFMVPVAAAFARQMQFGFRVRF
ncbi:MAG: TonB-dependent receptor [Acidobacteria bacterium]|nr:TonB-dependent receptor [Acidobacteriota bacterium]